MTPESGSFAHLLVPIDFSATSQSAVARARWIARRCNAEVHLIHAIRYPLVAMPHEVVVPQITRTEIRAAAATKLEEVRAGLETDGVKASAQLSEAEPVEAMAAAARAHASDLVVMGTHGYGGMQHLFLGSVAERALRTLNVPVLCVKEDEAAAAEAIERILVAVDFSDDSQAAVDLASALARALGAGLEVLHVFDVPADLVPYAVPIPEKMIEQLRDAAAHRLETVVDALATTGLPVASHLRRGSAAPVIAAEAERLGVDLIAVGTRGLTGLQHILVGSVAERTLRLSPCSILATRAPSA